MSYIPSHYTNSPSTQLYQMLFFVAFFHGSEYLLAIYFHGRSNVGLDSLLLSKSYVLAMACSLAEYAAGRVIVPSLKHHCCVSGFGLLMVVAGDLLRKLAIITAGRAFTHVIRTRHVRGHELVTRGVYRFVRHPAYSGFFFWAVGTQFLLCNPISSVAFSLVLWRFFSQRIKYEEYFLKQFFGPKYEDYASMVISGLPFVA